MKKVVTLVLAGGRVDELSVLTLARPKSTVPFGGMYRVIDFPLSNLMHSGIEKVGVLGQYRSVSLYNHVGIGSWWDFVGRERGVTMLSPSTAHNARDWYKGTADAVYQNLEFVQDLNPQAVLILSGDHIYKMDYQPMFRYHLEKQADLTVAFLPVESSESSRFGMADLDDEDGDMGGRVREYLEKPANSKYTWASMTVFLFRPEVLYRVLEQNAAQTSHEFGRDVIPAMLDSYRVYGFKFRGYWGYTRTIDEFWQTNMELLGEHPKIDLEKWQVRTNLDHDRLRDRPPARIGKRAEIANSLIQKGCKIEGRVENSILFPGVQVAEDAVVRDSILFYDTAVDSGAVLNKVIADVETNIGRDVSIGDGEASVPNKDHPRLLNTGITLLGRGVHLPQKLRLGSNCIVSPRLTEKDFKEKSYESGMTIS